MNDSDDQQLLARALDYQLDEKVREAFLDMRTQLQRRRSLTPKQRAYVTSVLEENSPVYLNEFSAGLIPRGNEVATPPALQNLPKRPPHRRHEV